MSYVGPFPLLTKNGGTGSSSLTNHGVLVGAGTSAITQLAAAGTGTVLIGNGASADPSFSATPSVTSITITNAPSAGTDGTNKAYVDAVASGFTFQTAVVAASTGAYTATYANGAAGVGATLTNNTTQAAFSIDGVSPIVNDRVLIKDQASTFQNGIYTVTTVGSGATNWVLTRATDYDQTTEIKPGNLVPVTSGTVNASTVWLQTQTVTTIGTDPILFSLFSGGSLNTFHTDSGNATVSASAITVAGGSNINTSGTGATVTVNLNNSPSVSGSLTAGTSVTAGTTVTAGTGITATTGNIAASSGNVTASAAISAGTALSSGTSTTVGNGLTVTTGGASISGTLGITFRGLAAGYTGSNWVTKQSAIQTTDATPTVLVSTAVADSQMISIKAYINGFRSTFASAIGAEVFLTVMRSSGGNVALVGTPIVNTNTNTTCDVTCTVDTGTQVAQILVTGVAAQTFNWVSTYEYMLLNTNA